MTNGKWRPIARRRQVNKKLYECFYKKENDETDISIIVINKSKSEVRLYYSAL